MGPIQTALNKLINLGAGGIAAGKKMYEHERQISAAKEQEAAKAAEQAAAEEKEAAAVATEADVRNLGGTPLEARAYRLAQERGLASPKRIIFDEKGEAVATYGEMASLLADNSLEDTLSSRLRGKEAIKVRKQLLEGKTHKQRVEDALLSIGGGRK